MLNVRGDSMDYGIVWELKGGTMMMFSRRSVVG